VQGWLHRDIKLGNIVINQITRQVALIDIASMVPIGTPSISGTLGFLAPELCQRLLLDGELMYVNDALGFGVMHEVVTDKLDVFAAGMVVLLWHVGRHPDKLRNGSDFDSIASCTAADLREFLRLYVSDDAELAEILFDTLHLDPAQRWTAMQAIKHKFIRDAVHKVGIGEGASAVLLLIFTGRRV
jgi:serine/threonine protein kinase